MKKSELIQEVTEKVKKEMESKNVKVNQEITKAYLDALEETIVEVIEADDKVIILGAKFEAKEQKGRTSTHRFGKNAGEQYTVPDKIVPNVKFTDATKKRLSKEV